MTNKRVKQVESFLPNEDEDETGAPLCSKEEKLSKEEDELMKDRLASLFLADVQCTKHCTSSAPSIWVVDAQRKTDIIQVYFKYNGEFDFSIVDPLGPNLLKDLAAFADTKLIIKSEDHIIPKDRTVVFLSRRTMDQVFDGKKPDYLAHLKKCCKEMLSM